MQRSCSILMCRNDTVSHEMVLFVRQCSGMQFITAWLHKLSRYVVLLADTETGVCNLQLLPFMSASTKQTSGPLQCSRIVYLQKQSHTHIAS